MLRLTASLTLLLAVSACSQSPSPEPFAYDEARVRADIQELASDRYQGRLPTTEGETLTLAYLEGQFKAMGLEPGNGDSYLQAVPMVRHTTEKASLTVDGETYRYLYDMVLNSFSDQPQLTISQSDVVFVGYGIHAPEYGWNDYAGLDVTGKTVVMLVNDPGFATGEPTLFKGDTMTYYGRWDYKFAEAGRQGAAAALIIHDTKPASYPWLVVQNSWTGTQLGLADVSDPHPLVEGWIKKDAAKRLLAQSGLNLDSLMAEAVKGPMHRTLGVQAEATLTQTIERATSYNVLATLPGTSRAEEQVIYTAHWDHIGSQGDQVYNGAMDNASGLASMLEIARAFVAAPPTKRSVSFLAVTGEEQGLLGSRYYAANPVFPLDRTVGVFNSDSTNIYGPTRDFTVVGLGQSSLEQYLLPALKAQGRELSRESNPGAGGYFRSDHFSFAQKGVPALFAGGGRTALNEEVAAGRAAVMEMMKGCYHNHCDTYRPEWDLRGAMQDIEVYFKAGHTLADDDRWPGFLAGSEFHSLRPAL
ncbi:M28 family metallopeptidase [Ferrimonas balearica]|uniref:M28 family metallopeptidase n=1 Tax=Ferrimonas balearica TaxID=44012 RepID=UPI001C98F0D6|nr:M28 family metallopeptidase [Ferrimonas balearica]MBY5921089.1 M28 family peptidase [Ferrimonas balearica]MBY5996226.1 M28 family peptidase [Ferrimonas balearica]